MSNNGIDKRKREAYNRYRKVNESSGQGEIPYRQYSLRTPVREPMRWNSAADSIVWMREEKYGRI